MLKMILFSVLSVFVAGAASATSAKTYNYKANWIEAKKHSYQSGNATVGMRMYQRMIRLGNVVFPVATLTTGEIKSTTEEGFPKDMSQAVQELTGIQNWKKEVRGNYTAYEAPLPDQARILKLFISKQKGVYKYSIASVRFPYMMPAYYEAEILQREQIGDLKGVAALENDSHFYALMFKALVSPAYAVSILDMLNSWQGTLQGTSGAINNGASAINNGAFAVNNGAAALNNASSVVNNARGTVDNLGNTFRNSSNSVVNSMNYNVDRVDRTANKINDTMKGFQDPTKMGKVAFAAGIGGALGYGAGALLFQFAIDGSVKVARKIFYSITGNLPPELKSQISAEGNQAWNDLEKYSEQLTNLENELGKNLLAINELTGENPVAAFADIDPKLQDYHNRLAQIEEALASQTDQESRMACMQEAFTIKQQMQTLEALKPALAKQSMADIKRDACSRLEGLYRQWSQLEMNIYNARGILVENVGVLMDNAQANVRNANKRKISDRENQKLCEKSVEDQMDDINSDLSKNGCVCDARVLSGTCRDICRTKELTKSYVQDCLDMAEMRKDVNPTRERLRQAEMLKNYSEMMKENYKNLVNAYCEPGEQGNGCAGETGSFGRTKDQLGKLFTEASQRCGPNSNVLKAAANAGIRDGIRKATSAMMADMPLSSKEPPKPAESGGFLQKVGTWFKGLFGIS